MILSRLLSVNQLKTKDNNYDNYKQLSKQITN